MVFRQTKKPTHLSFQILVYIFIATVVSSCLYFTMQRFSEIYITSVHPNRNTIFQRVESLQTYIDDKNITEQSFDQLNDWAKQYPYSLFYIYNNSKLLYTNDLEVEVRSFDTVNDASYPLQTFGLKVDGDSLRVDIMSQDIIEFLDRFDQVNRVVSFIAFITVMCILLRSMTLYIETITNELNAIGGGMLETKVSEQGNDELTDLARGINMMREALIANTEMVVRSQEALKDATTTLSHDIRTPMTILLGYLEYLQNDQSLDPSHHDKIQRCYQKAHQVKDLAQALLQCFTDIANQEDHSFPIIKTSFQDLKQDFLKQLMASLEVHGLDIVVEDCVQDLGWCYVSHILMHRIFDNITSNIIKYAQYEHGVTVKIMMKGSKVWMIIENDVAVEPRNQESYGIGLRSCDRLMSLQDGSLTWNRIGNRFQVCLALTVKNY
ncbi:sensor histidine kinase [Erysipelothrix sp. strain 2 (EsS2-7-Brazil)]|uniref:sensor histidine kinase n=1 Tax=Erysipelothrix sp. strain 2 (EsS2-7-Brazil) TaxID=2500579 RepID=UPI001F2AD618|nr:HAMP domain-containing sensor histidine kinase [Erysipelothrix sp. strain 2 (EsS2-7-Brazil)]